MKRLRPRLLLGRSERGSAANDVIRHRATAPGPALSSPPRATPAHAATSLLLPPSPRIPGRPNRWGRKGAGRGKRARWRPFSRRFLGSCRGRLRLAASGAAPPRGRLVPPPPRGPLLAPPRAGGEGSRWFWKEADPAVYKWGGLWGARTSEVIAEPESCVTASARRVATLSSAKVSGGGGSRPLPAVDRRRECFPTEFRGSGFGGREARGWGCVGEVGVGCAAGTAWRRSCFPLCFPRS